MSNHQTLTAVLVSSVITTGTIGILYTVNNVSTRPTALQPVATASATPSAVVTIQPSISPTIKQSLSPTTMPTITSLDQICQQQATAPASRTLKCRE